MQIVIESRIVGEFYGWNGDNLYEFDNGQIWKQNRYKYHYYYRYRPEAKILKDGSHYYLQVEGMRDMIEVSRRA